MADIFLSYKKEDRERAAAVVAALQESGKSVWWDEGLTPRQAWDATIEQEIAAASSVVVLWSTRSVASDWVRTEAHYAQDRGKLVPVLIEPCTIPLAFMLKQAVDLTHWNGSTQDPSWVKLLHWLQQGHPAEVPRATTRPTKDRWRRPALRIASVLAAAALLGGLFVYLSHGRPKMVSGIRVARFDILPGDSAAVAFSQGFAADLAQIIVSGGSKLRVLDATSPESSAAAVSEFTLNGNVRGADGKLRASLTLNSSADGSIIWSTNLVRPIAEADAMRREAEVRMGAVFVCALDETAQDRSVVSLDALKVYLQACESLPSGDDLQTRKILRDVTRLAPGFAQGWATLAEWNGFIVSDGDDDAAADVVAARREAEDAAAHALTIDPRNSSAWVARAMLKTTISEWALAQSDLDKALALNPDDPIGNYFYASNLINVGRTKEAFDYALRAANSGPRFWPKTLQVATTLAELNRIDEAEEMMAQAIKTWPDNDYLKNMALILAARYGDAHDVAQKLDDRELTAGQAPEHLQVFRLEAAARNNPTPKNLADAAHAIATFYGGVDRAYGAAINYMVIGSNDEAYASFAQLATPLRQVPYGNNPSPFFRLFGSRFRADPRFMPLAYKIGLVGIWQQGKWPNFCAAGAPYDCKIEAQKAAQSAERHAGG